jgi:FAD/FMN-containing dehydrogenase/quercetin dioxygenase-like cupin family protein
MTRTLLRSLAGIVGEPHVLTGDATAGYAVDWTGRFAGHTPAVVRPRDTAEVAAVLALCTDAGLPVVPQGGNTGLVGGGVPLHGEVVLSLTRLNRLGPVDHEAAQVTAGAGVTLQQVADADPGLDLPILIASRDSATVGGAVATNAGGLRVLRFGPMRAQLRGIEAVLADGTVVSHLAGLVKDNTGYDYPSLLAGSEGTLAVVTAARLRLVPRLRDTVTALTGVGDLDELHALARRAVREVPGLVSAEFFTQAGLDILVAHAGLTPPLPTPAAAYLLLDASGPGAFGDLAGLISDREAAVGESAADRARLWSYRERHSEAAGFLGVPVKLDVSVPAARWVRLASSAAAVVTDVHGIGALKAPWLPLARTDAERALFARIRSAFDPSGTLNPNVLPRLSPGSQRRATPRPGAGSSCVMTDFLAGYVVPPGAGLADDPGLKASQHSTGGALSVFETTVEAGPPLHVHDRDDECLYVLDGELSIRCGSDVFDAAAGSFVFLPRGRPHRFWARDTSARLLLIAVPGGIEDYFGQINNASDDVERHRIGERYGIRVVPD